jgi:release factor glutamine methyltransferase
VTAAEVTAAEVLRAAVLRLREVGIDDPARDARKLLAHAMRISPDRVTLHLPEPLAQDHRRAFEEAIALRAKRQPVSQIIGAREFFGRRFHVTKDTLDPRPETEVLVEVALARPFSRVLDLGTGTGCILLSLLAERANVTGVGADVSSRALLVAAANAVALELQDRADWLCSDWFADVEGRFDLIVSNPPYIAADEMAALEPEVRDWEPHQALTPGGDGLAAYRAISRGADAHLTEGGHIAVEIGPSQGAAVMDMFRTAGFRDVHLRQDLDGRDRVVVAQKHRH